MRQPDFTGRAILLHLFHGVLTFNPSPVRGERRGVKYAADRAAGSFPRVGIDCSIVQTIRSCPLAACAEMSTIERNGDLSHMKTTTTQAVAAALDRAAAVFRRRPDAGLHDDAAAAARWEGGLRIVASHANGTRIPSDMPASLGGSGDQVTPGWLFRAGLASCSAASIAMTAAAEGIELAALEVHANSKSDARALVGVAETDGSSVYAGPSDVRLSVRIVSQGVAPERLRALVEEGLRRSTVFNVLPNATPVTVDIDVGAEMLDR
jgi:uncharacterized OsmC-like protein